MAVIQKLRNSGVIIIIVAIVLVIFIVQSAVSDKNRNSSDYDPTAVGEIFGKKITLNDLNGLTEKYYRRQMENDPNFQPDDLEEYVKQLGTYAWNEKIQEFGLEKIIKDAGIEITEQDKSELTQGKHPADQIAQEQSFQENGAYSPAMVTNLIKQAKSNPQLKRQLENYFEGIYKQALQDRFNTHFIKLNYTPMAIKKYEFKQTIQGVNGKLVVIDLKTILDKDIKVTDKDLEVYLKEHKEQFKNSEDARDVEYVKWDVVPSSSDTASAYKEAEEFISSVKNKVDTLGTDVINNFLTMADVRNGLKKDTSVMRFWLSAWSAKQGEVMGPVKIDDKLWIVQVVDTKMDTADATINAKHILIPFQGQLPNKSMVADSVAALKIANEVLGKVKGGGDFAALAKDFSGDAQSGAKGGELGESQASKYLPEFKKWTITHNKGDIGLVKSQYGYHIIKLNTQPERKKIKIKRKSIELLAGKNTIKAVEEKIANFRKNIDYTKLESFATAAQKAGLNPLVQDDLKTNSAQLPYIDKPEDVKSIINWLFTQDRKDNDVSDNLTVNAGKGRIVIHCTNVKNKGYADINDVRKKLEKLVRAEMKGKKIADEKFAKALATAKTPEELAKISGGVIVPLTSYKLTQGILPAPYNTGKEEKISGAIFGMPIKTFSKPIIGNTIVAVVYIESKEKGEIPKGFTPPSDPMENSPYLAYTIPQTILSEIQKLGELKDFRYRFEDRQYCERLLNPKGGQQP